MIFETAAILGISQTYTIASFIAAFVRILILIKQPPPPRPTPFEMGRQALLTFILVAFAEPAAELIGISAEYAILAGIAVALHGTDRVATYIKDIIKLLLPEKLAKRIEEIDAVEEQKKIDATHKQQIKNIKADYDKKEQEEASTKLRNDDYTRE
ncbi:hypothetical protein [Vreelandella titanicae]|uniref:Uncharacterized protein n=1 Tax=Vreelandella titanicae TaxID=664683 RepID=A0AAP9NLT5_9GAMM|nr:hypothetical protein [Halomonas titanicae]QKS24613.1 hypothetical protein FX987_02395 [Halomonas titanicae]